VTLPQDALYNGVRDGWVVPFAHQTRCGLPTVRSDGEDCLQRGGIETSIRMNPTASLGGGNWSHLRSFFLTLGLSMIGLIIYELLTLRGQAAEWDRFAWEFVVGVVLAGVFLSVLAILCNNATLHRWFDLPGRRAYERLDQLDRRIVTPQALFRKLVALARS
jgi:hypothetical protein